MLNVYFGSAKYLFDVLFYNKHIVNINIKYRENNIVKTTAEIIINSLLNWRSKFTSFSRTERNPLRISTHLIPTLI